MTVNYGFVFARCKGSTGGKIQDNRLRTARFNPYNIATNIKKLSTPCIPWTLSAPRKELESIHATTFDMDQQKVNAVINHAWSTSTLERYDAYVREFFAFCRTRGIQTSKGFHASERLLCAFAASMAGSKAGGTASAKISALKAWHIQNDLPWMGSSRLKYTLKGTESLRPLDSIKEKRPPVSMEMFHIFRDHLDLSSPEDACIWAVACTTFWSQIRMGEFCPKTEKNYDMDTTPTWERFGPPFSRGTRTLHLPRTKRGGVKGETVVVTR